MCHKEIPMIEPNFLSYRIANRDETTTNTVTLLHKVGQTDFKFRLGYTQYSSLESDTPKNLD